MSGPLLDQLLAFYRAEAAQERTQRRYHEACGQDFGARFHGREEMWHLAQAAELCEAAALEREGRDRCAGLRERVGELRRSIEISEGGRA